MLIHLLLDQGSFDSHVDKKRRAMEAFTDQAQKMTALLDEVDEPAEEELCDNLDNDCDELQVYLVTGGCIAKKCTGGRSTVTDQTEVLTAGDLAWVKLTAAPLPSARAWLKGASINNGIIVSGECS